MTRKLVRALLASPLLRGSKPGSLARRLRNRLYRRYRRLRGRAEIVVYTCITGGYDELIDHHWICCDWDYVLFSDRPVERAFHWEVRCHIPVRDAPSAAHGGGDDQADERANREAKYCKLFPDRMLTEYRHSLWVDGHVDLTSPEIRRRVDALLAGDARIGLVEHPDRDCIYDEAKACLRYLKEQQARVDRLVAFLRQHHYPPRQGLYAMGLIFRRHCDPEVIRLMTDWWQMISRFSRRDQLSFCFVLWRNPLSVDLLFGREEVAHAFVASSDLGVQPFRLAHHLVVPASGEGESAR